MPQLSDSIVRVVSYFDIFSYPITLEEIRLFLDQPAREEEVMPAIRLLVEKQLIYQLGRFYSLKNDLYLVERRETGNTLAVQRLKRAMKMARVISWYPFVRGVAISGSLSKNFAYKGSDLDFFVIMAANRLWIGRIFLLAMVRVFVTIGLKRMCCLNYYVDEEAVEIEEKNIFTAVEVVTLLPARGKQSFQRFFAANQWTQKYLPNSVCKKTPAEELPAWPLKRFLEWLMDNRVGNSIDNWLMKYFGRRWEKLLLRNKIVEHGVPLGAVMSGKHICKPDSRYFQQRTLNRLQDRIADLKTRHPENVRS